MSAKGLVQSQSAETAPQSEHLRILLVDDEPNIREALAEYLMAINSHQVVTAGSGEEALAVFAPDAYDCAFLDLKMPGMSGVEPLARLRGVDPKLPVVIMTGFPSLDAAIDTMRQGASDFLIKPFNLGQVKMTLERVVREHRLLRENLRLAERLAHQEKIERLNQELGRRVHEQNIIHQISDAVDRLQTSEDLYQGMADLAARFLEVQRSAVLLLDRATNQLLVIAEHGFPARRAVGRAAGRLGSGVPGKVAAEGQPMLGRPGSDVLLEQALPTEGAYLCLPIRIREETFGVMLVADKKSGGSFRGDDIFLLRFLLDKAGLSIENIALYESMVSNLHSTLGALVNAMEAKDPYTRQHSRRVTNLSVLTAQTMGLEISDIESLRFAAYLHDIGKIGVKDNVLLKASRLDPAEYELIKQHPVIGETIIQAMDLSDQERAIIRHHHERWDGAGYPDGLSGDGIPLLARLVAISDAFDAMTTDRPYRTAKSQADAVQELMRCAGSQFDRQVVRAFVEMLARYQPSALDEAGRLD
ncbi:MAG: HD domain-containing phosphohydrolase [Pseudomonadota bacterium]